VRFNEVFMKFTREQIDLLQAFQFERLGIGSPGKARGGEQIFSGVDINLGEKRFLDIDGAFFHYSGTEEYWCNIKLVKNSDQFGVYCDLCQSIEGTICKHVLALYSFVLNEMNDALPSLPAIVPSAWVEDILTQSWQSEEAGVDNAQKTWEEQAERLFYILKPKGDNQLGITFQSSRILKDGSWSDKIRGRELYDLYELRPKVLSPADVYIICQIQGLRIKKAPYYYSDSIQITEALLPCLFEHIIPTGRCFFQKRSTVSLEVGNAKPISPAWTKSGKGYKPTLSQNVPFMLAAGSKTIWIDPGENKIGLVTSKATSQVLNSWASGPLMLEEDLVIAEGSLVKAGLPVPKLKIKVEILKPGLPISRLKLEVRDIEHLHSSNSYRVKSRIIATPCFDYNGHLVEPKQKDGRIEISKEPFILLERDLVHEAEQIAQLAEFEIYQIAQIELAHIVTEEDKQNFVMSRGMYGGFEEEWHKFCTKYLPALEGLGWKVEFGEGVLDPVFRTQESDWEAVLDQAEGSGIDWFSFDISTSVEGQRFELMPVLRAMLESGQPIPEPGETKMVSVPIPDAGRSIEVPSTILRMAMRFLLDLFDGGSEQGSSVMIPSLEAAWLAGENPDWLKIEKRAAKATKLSDRLKNFRSIKKITPPKTLKAELRDYQLEGLSWLQFLREYGLNGILADDMGLGKTVQAIAHLLKERAARRAKLPSLVIAPTSVLPNWEAEAKRFAPSLKVLRLHGPDRAQYFDSLDQYHLVITSYPLLSRDVDKLKSQTWHLLMLDEAQAIKNPRTKVAMAACQLKANHRVCLSGTPIENHLGELWSQVNFLMPGYLSTSNMFRQLFRNPIEKHGSIERQEILSQRVSPLILRRTKEQVATELPEKIVQEQHIELNKDQLGLYETVRAAMDKRVRDAIAEKGLNRSGIIVLDAMLKLRQICCHPALLKKGFDQNKKLQSAKLDRLMEMIPELITSGRRILLFSQFTSMLDIIEKELLAANVGWIRLDGSTRDRETPVNEFQAGKVPLFLISLKAGGTGLNLTSADTVIHYDPWWNPAVENQATDRAHRIGQTKQVHVHRLICTGTIEERIQELQRKKAGLVDGILSGKAGKMKLTQEDVDLLMRPVGEL